MVEGEYTVTCRNTSIYDTGEEWEELDCEIESIEDLRLSISIPLIGAPKCSLSSSNGGLVKETSNYPRTNGILTIVVAYTIL